MKDSIFLIVLICLTSCEFPRDAPRLGEKNASPETKEVFNYPYRAIIEIPSGTNVKYELDKNSGELTVEKIDGEPRKIDYLPYPSNYGMIPKTLQASAEGGDGDPLDVIVLGPALEAGKEYPIRVVGVLKLLDNGEKDDKLIAVCSGNSFSQLESLDELELEFPGLTEILKIWFLNYKGADQMQWIGLGDERDAQNMIDQNPEE